MHTISRNKLGKEALDPGRELGAIRDPKITLKLQWVQPRPTQTVANDEDPRASLPINGSKHACTAVLEVIRLSLSC